MPNAIDITLSVDQGNPVEVELNYSATPPVAIELTEPEAPVIEIEFGNIGPKGDPGDGTALTAIAGQDLSSGRVVYIDGGVAKYYDPSDVSLASKVVGITKNAALETGTVNIVTAGVCNIPGFGLTADEVYYAGANGVPVISVAGLTVIQRIGAAISSDKIVINFSSPIITN